MPIAVMLALLVRGALALVVGRRIRHHRMPMGGAASRPDRRMRLGVLLATGHEARLVVAPESRDAVALQYRLEGSQRPAEVMAAFTPCDPAAPRFGGKGTVGRATVWAGGLLVRELTCARLLVYVDEQRLPDVRLPLGRPCRPPARIREMGCDARSSGVDLRGAFSDPRNITVGPITFLGAADAAEPAAAPVIRRLGWWKSPLLLTHDVKAVISVAWERRRSVRLVGWGAEGEGRALRLAACGAEEGDDVNGTGVTWWSGAIALDRVPTCVALDVWIGLEPSRRVRLPFGARDACGRG